MQTVVLENEMTHFVEDHLGSYLDLLRQMVGINSFTANPRGVNELADMTAAAFYDLGFTAERVQAENLLYGKHLILERQGAAQGGQPVPKIGLISHLDTVYPAAEEKENDFYWRPQGERIYGPGVFDIKGGTVMIYAVLEALQRFFPRLYEAVTWVVLLNAAEEALVPDFGRLCLDRLQGNALAALVFEGGEYNAADRQSFQFVTARKGMARYYINVEGKAAHAGTAHPNGANAIVQIADVIHRISEFTDYDQALTFNVGTIAGGTVTNRVPHRASAAVEMRAFTPDVFNIGLDKMAALNDFSSVRSPKGAYPCRVEVEVLGLWSPWAPNPSSDRIFLQWQDAARQLGFDALQEKRGGLSDGNWTWEQIPTLDGLGPQGGNAHCSERSDDGSKDQEFIIPDSYISKVVINALAVRNLVERQFAELETPAI